MESFPWAVFYILASGLVFTGYIVLYILHMAYREMGNGCTDTAKQKELLQL
jgi:hypothetical protein